MWFLIARIIRKRRKAKREAHDQAQASLRSELFAEQKDADGPAGKQPNSPTSSTFWFKVRLLVALLLPVLLETLDYTIVATAQPRIASVFNALSLQSYIGTAYLLSSTVFLPLFASLADVFGSYSGLQLSLTFFLIGSAISTGAVNMAMMLIGRGIAGIGAAGLLAIVRTILSDSRSLDDNNWQTTILFLLYAIGFAIGPLFGGYLVAVSFCWVFVLSLPICVVSIVLCHLLLRNKVKGGQPYNRLVENHAEQETFCRKLLRIDWIGTFLFIAGGILVLLALNWGSTDSWDSVRVILSCVLGPLLIIACLLWEHVLERQLFRITPSRHKVLNCDPMLPLKIFRSYNVCAVMYGSTVSGMVMLVMFYFVSIFMTIVVGKTPAEASIQLPKYPILLGSMILPISLGLIEWAISNNDQNQVNGFMVLAGSGVGLTAGPLAIQARFSLTSNRVAVVSSMTLFFRSLGGTIGLAQCSTVVNAKVDDYLKDLVASGALTGSAAIANLNGLPPAVRTAVRDAFRYGLQWSFISLIPWAGLSFFVLFFLSEVSDRDRAREEEETMLEKEACQRELMKDDGKT